MDEKEYIEQAIRDLECDLAATDYKVIKHTEYTAMGKPAPYDINAVYAERQAKRDKINELQAQLAMMDR